MPQTTNRKWIYPRKGLKPYFHVIAPFYEQIDTDVQTLFDRTIKDISPAMSKGSLITDNGTDTTILNVGVDGYSLIADSTQPTGLKWAPVSGTESPIVSKTFYVATTGNDLSGDGTIGLPYATIGQCFKEIPDVIPENINFTIKIANGIYDSFPDEIRNKIANTSQIVIDGYEGLTNTIAGPYTIDSIDSIGFAGITINLATSPFPDDGIRSNYGAPAFVQMLDGNSQGSIFAIFKNTTNSITFTTYSNNISAGDTFRIVEPGVIFNISNQILLAPDSLGTNSSLTLHNIYINSSYENPIASHDPAVRLSGGNINLSGVSLRSDQTKSYVLSVNSSNINKSAMVDPTVLSYYTDTLGYQGDPFHSRFCFHANSMTTGVGGTFRAGNSVAIVQGGKSNGALYTGVAITGLSTRSKITTQTEDFYISWSAFGRLKQQQQNSNCQAMVCLVYPYISDEPVVEISDSTSANITYLSFLHTVAKTSTIRVDQSSTIRGLNGLTAVVEDEYVLKVGFSSNISLSSVPTINGSLGDVLLEVSNKVENWPSAGSYLWDYENSYVGISGDNISNPITDDRYVLKTDTIFEAGTGTLSALRKDASNSAGGAFDFVVGGNNSTGATGNSNSVFGYGNSILGSTPFSAIFGYGNSIGTGGNANFIAGEAITTGSYCTYNGLFGYNYNLGPSSDCNIIGGWNHQFSSINAIDYNVIGGNEQTLGYGFCNALFGYQNTLSDNITYSIVAGYRNGGGENSYGYAMFGSNNNIGSASHDCIIGGNDNTIGSSCVSDIICGSSNIINNSSSYNIVSGMSNTVASSLSGNILSGYENSMSSSYNTIMTGAFNTSNTANNSVTFGYKTNAYLNSCLFSSAGHPVDSIDAETGQGQIISHIPHSGQSTSATPVRLYFDGNQASQNFITVDDHAYILETIVVAKCTAGASLNGVKSWKIYTTINNTSGGLTIVGSNTTVLNRTTIANESSWTIQPYVYDTNVIAFRATGYASETIRWQCASTAAEIGTL